MARLVFMQVEDGMVTFEKEDGTTFLYPANSVPSHYKEGDIIRAYFYSPEYIVFEGLDTAEMERRRAISEEKKSSIRNRVKRNNKNNA